MTYKNSITRNNAAFFHLVIVFIFGLWVASPDVPAPHTCNWDECDLTNRTEFYTAYPEGSDGYYYELTHWNHPEWTYEECEDYIFEGQATITRDL